MAECCNSKNRCGGKQNSAHVLYERELPSVSELNDGECVTLEDTTSELYRILETMQQSISTEGIGRGCIDYEESELGKVKLFEALTAFEREICKLKETLSKEDNKGVDISEWSLDTKCLSDPCGDEFSTLKQLMQAIIDKVCSL